MYIKINIISINNILFKNKIKYIKILNLGLEIHFNHIPILALIKDSLIIIYITNDKKKIFYIKKGILEFNLNILNILTSKLIKSIDLNKKNINNKLFFVKKKISLYKRSNNLLKYLKYKNLFYRYFNYLKLINLSK